MIKKGSIIRRTNIFGSPIGDYLQVVSIGKETLHCKYISCDVNAYVNKKRYKELKKRTIKVSNDDYLKLKLANIGIYKHNTTAQFTKLEDDLPDIVAFYTKGKPILYYRVGMIYPVIYKCRNHTMIELIDLINK
jgi:hypothetical protein